MKINSKINAFRFNKRQIQMQVKVDIFKNIFLKLGKAIV